VRDAAALGAIVTVTHTIGVFALGLVTLALSQWIVPDRLYPWINLTAGLLVISIGITVLRARARLRNHDHEHDHRHEHEHGHHHHHHHHEERGLLAVGISGGLLRARPRSSSCSRRSRCTASASASR
jgi:ABC-type nickel/cobalt efflux system permease component RcnA